MEFVARLRRLWRIGGFRRLLVVRIAAQIADGISQMGVVSFALFNPQQAANAWAVVTVLAITLLPFSLIGPFTGVLLDRWPRQRMVIVTESIRLVLCLVVAALLAWTSALGGTQIAIYVLILIVLSFNRFLLNGLSAGLADVVEEKDYLDASSVMPMLGPLGMVAGGLVAGIIRLAIGQDAANVANAFIFLAAGACCVVTVVLASRIGRLEIGPLPEEGGHHTPQTGSPAQIWHGLAQAWVYLRRRGAAMHGLGSVAVQHTMYGVVMTCIIMAYRNYFHSP
ncbi:MAG: MFS transporter, partial [Actinomycetia bacterium]|nr:MFS transporter [Actinomycetes bacterium]